MAAIVRAVSASKTTTICSPIMKEEEKKNVKNMEKLGCELKESVGVCKDLSKEISKKHVNGDVVVVVDDDDDDDDDDFFECDSEKDVDPKSSHDETHVEKDKGDEKLMKNEEALSKVKQQPLGSIETPIIESKEAEVQILSLSVLSPGRRDVVLPIPFPQTTSKATLFTLKEGSKYKIKFHFFVSNNNVNGLKYTYMVWKAGVRVHQTKKMMGTFSPRKEAYTFELEEGTTPTGFFARGPFLVRSRFVDDDGNCYLDTTYYFDIRKDWGAREKC